MIKLYTVKYFRRFFPMLKEDVLKKLTDCGLVAVVRANNAERK